MFVPVVEVDGLLVCMMATCAWCSRVRPSTYVTCAWVAWAHVCPYHTCAVLVGVMYIKWLIWGGMCVSRLCLCVSYVCGWRRRGAGWWPWPMRLGFGLALWLVHGYAYAWPAMVLAGSKFVCLLLYWRLMGCWCT